MGLGYDVFKKLEDGGAIWVGAAATLDEAKKLLAKLESLAASHYFVRDATSGRIVASTDSGNLGKASA
jgi:hypothetical protein